jgi:hypothetical protein
VKVLRCFMVAVSTFALGTSGFAATVTPVEGTVQVNTGSGFHPVSGAAEVAAGSSVMVSPKGRAKISYSDGCKTTLHPGSVAVVPPVSPCAQGQAYRNDDCRDHQYRPDCDPTQLYIAGAALAAAAGIGIYAAMQHSTTPASSPTSP